MGTIKKILALSLVFITVTLLLAGCFLVKSDEEMIRERLEEFTTAYNTGDLAAVLNCFNAKTRNTYQSLLNVGDSLTGMAGLGLGLSNLWSLGVATMGPGDVLSLSNLRISISGDTRARVTATMEFHDGDGESREDVAIPMIKEKGDWYIYVENALNFD